jgi:biotin-(acetyl-CoA carboxylase) ligase
MQGEATTDDPFARAQALAALGCDSGTVVHNLQADVLRAAIVFAPEVPLEEAMAMLPLCGLGFQNALGALAPPEVAVHLAWDGAIRVNGAGCGALEVAGSTADPRRVPDWLVVGLHVPLLMTGDAPGETPDVTALYNEGCADVDAVLLLESWARHCLSWIHRWDAEGNAALHGEWIGLVPGVGEDVAMGDRTGTFLGVDEQFGMLIRDGKSTHLVPMSSLVTG